MRRLSIAVSVVALMVTSCGDDPAETTAVPPTSTSASTTTTTGTDDPEVWDLVYISDSSGWGVADAYAARIEDDMGVQVEVHDLWSPNLPALRILEALQGLDLPTRVHGPVDIVPLIAEAEVIVVYGSTVRSETEEHPWDFNCPMEHQESPACIETTSCGPETYTQYEAHLGEIYQQIFAIRKGEPVILRTADYYLPWGPLQTWRECGHTDVCTQCMANLSEAIHRAADRYNVPVAGLMEAFSGPHLDQEMPREYVWDDVHPSEEGAAAIADVLADLGYQPVAP